VSILSYYVFYNRDVCRENVIKMYTLCAVSENMFQNHLCKAFCVPTDRGPILMCRTPDDQRGRRQSCKYYPY
jgi:hypothetical protein